MGAVNMQGILTLFARIVSGELASFKSNVLQSFVHVGPGVYQLTFSSVLNALEQFPTITPCGADGTADYEYVIVGGGPQFTQLNIQTYLAGSPADVDCYVGLEWIAQVSV